MVAAREFVGLRDVFIDLYLAIIITFVWYLGYKPRILSCRDSDILHCQSANINSDFHINFLNIFQPQYNYI